MFSQEFFLSAGEVNAEAELSLPLLTSKIIDIATAHANSLGIGNPSMEHLGCGWVLSRLTIEMSSYPKVNQIYTLHTWVEDWNRHFSTRCFRIDNEEGEPLGYARSIWMVMNTQTHENAGLTHLHLEDKEIESNQQCPIPRQKKHLHIPETQIINHYRFRYCDIDFYRHVNTVRYVVILLNQFSLEEMDHNMVRRMELSFLHEGRYGSEVEIRRNEPERIEGSEYADIRKNEFMSYDTEKEREILYSRIELQKR